VGGAAEHEHPSPPPPPGVRTTGGVHACVRSAIFGPVVQRPLYLRTELSSITGQLPSLSPAQWAGEQSHTHTRAHARTHGTLRSAPRASPQRHACQQTGSDSAEPPGVTGGAGTHRTSERGENGVAVAG